MIAFLNLSQVIDGERIAAVEHPFGDDGIESVEVRFEIGLMIEIGFDGSGAWSVAPFDEFVEYVERSFVNVDVEFGKNLCGSAASRLRSSLC